MDKKCGGLFSARDEPPAGARFAKFPIGTMTHTQLMDGRASATEQLRHDPVAIVGLACNYPGAPDIAALWRVLIDGRSTIAPAPVGRWFAAQSLRGGFVDGSYPQCFDAQFFDLSPAEAL